MVKPIIEPVPKLWPNSTVVCLGSGPSLTQADVDRCREHARVIAVNDTVRMAPWADVLYAADVKWWRRFAGVPGFRGFKYSIMANTGNRPTAQEEFRDIRILRNTGTNGLELQPDALRTGCNSGYQAINLAVHFGARQILLLGYDMHGDHFFGSHPDKTRPPFAMCLPLFPTLVAPLKAAGVSIVNCTPRSAITCFPMGTLDAELTQAVVA